MAKITAETVKYTARLAHLEVSDDEAESLTSELEKIVSLVETINEVNTDGVAPLANVLESFGVTSTPLREDVAGESLGQDVVAELAPSFRDGHIMVPKVIDPS